MYTWLNDRSRCNLKVHRRFNDHMRPGLSGGFVSITDLELQSNTNKDSAPSPSSSLTCFARGNSSSLSGKVGATSLQLSSRFRRSLITSIMEGRLVGSSHVHIIAMCRAWNMAVLMLLLLLLFCAELAIIEESRSSDGSPLLRTVERTKSTRLPPSTSVLPVGSLPVRSSNKMTPKLYTSPRVVDLQNWPYSGGM